MRKLSLYLVLLCAIAIVLNSCIDEITLDIDNDEQFIIIDGLIADEAGVYNISINNSPRIGVGNDNILEPISGCDVKVIDASGKAITFQEDPEDPGEYNSFVDGLSLSQSYHVEVTLPNGDLITSEPQEFPSSVVPIDTIDWEVINVEFINESGNVARREYVEIYANTPPRTEDAYIRWRVTGEYDIVEKYFGILNPRHCYVKQTIDNNNVILANTFDFDGGSIIQEPIIRLPMDSRFHILYLFGVSQYTLNEAEFEYWSRIEQLINVEGTLFDPPPGILKGNLSNTTDPTKQVQGYFSVVRQASFNRFVNIAEKGFFADTDCQSRPNANNPAKCVDCTTLNRSTLTKPDYWLF